MKDLIRKKVLSKNWTFNEISDLTTTIQNLSEEVWQEMTLLERIDLVRDVRINETLVGWDFEHAIREVVLTSLKGEIAEIIKNMDCFNLKPASIINRLKLKNPIYSETAAYGHMGRESKTKNVSFINNGKKITKVIETFTWEKLDCIEDVKNAFNL